MAGFTVYKFAYVRTSGTALDGTAAGNARHLDPEEQRVRGLWVQSFGAGVSFVEAVDEVMVVQKRLRRK